VVLVVVEFQRLCAHPMGGKGVVGVWQIGE